MSDGASQDSGKRFTYAFLVENVSLTVVYLSIGLQPQPGTQDSGKRFTYALLVENVLLTVVYLSIGL
jgi:hypothetical protein